jgi:aminocarboxymuconate-semialdehyde decarboxylase
MKLDIFNHIFPPRFFARLEELLPKGPIERWKTIETLYDVDARLRMLDGFGNYQQILSLSQPPLDVLAGPDRTPALARLANDGLAALCRAHPDRFPSFIASPPMNNPDAAVAEIERAVQELGACGVQIHSNVAGKALDAPEFLPVFARIAELGRPVFLHPARPMEHADYLAEDVSRFEIFWGLGWAYETSAAMARIVFSGLFDKLPDLTIIAHHWGAYIPHAEGRIAKHWGPRSSQSADHAYGKLEDELKRPVIDYFKMFHVDTAMFGAVAASQAGLDFFGAGRSMFASDCPFDAEGGRIFMRDTIAVIDGLRCSDEDRAAIYSSNALALLGLG